MTLSERFLAARLRKGLDDDLYEATKELDSQSKSDLIRTGLRLALGIKTQKVVKVKEEPVLVRSIPAKISKTKVFVPNIPQK
jgi:Arc/MetJ-type ribon-helix-helix transcriptional regulator